jgi:hypothetical protein
MKRHRIDAKGSETVHELLQTMETGQGSFSSLPGQKLSRDPEELSIDSLRSLRK